MQKKALERSERACLKACERRKPAHPINERAFSEQWTINFTEQMFFLPFTKRFILMNLGRWMSMIGWIYDQSCFFESELS